MFLAIKTEILLSSALNKAVYAFISYHNHILDNHIHSGSVSVWILKIQSYWGKRVKKKFTYWSKQGTYEQTYLPSLNQYFFCSRVSDQLTGFI